MRAPTGVADALREQPRHRWLVDAMQDDARASAVARLDVYANMYFYRLRDTLALDFPRLHAALGDDAFHDLITDYLLAFPSRDASVRNVGRSLPSFLRTSAQAELAALDWACLDVFDRADEPVLTRARLAESARHGFDGLFLRTIAAHELVGARILVWRGVDQRVHERALERDEVPLLARLAHGIRFDELCAELGTYLPAEQAAHRALTWLSQWTDAGLLQGDAHGLPGYSNALAGEAPSSVNERHA